MAQGHRVHIVHPSETILYVASPTKKGTLQTKEQDSVPFAVQWPGSWISMHVGYARLSLLKFLPVEVESRRCPFTRDVQRRRGGSPSTISAKSVMNFLGYFGSRKR